MRHWTLISVSFMALLLAVANWAYARETSKLSIDEKIQSSDAIFIGRVVALEEPSPQLAGVTRYAVIDVKEVLKGDVTTQTRFVVSGYSAELNPSCCEVGKQYLFFAKHGYEVFELSGAEIGRAVRGEDQFLSATNGPYSTFLIGRKKVAGWSAGEECGSHRTPSLRDVQACIRTLSSPD